MARQFLPFDSGFLPGYFAFALLLRADPFNLPEHFR